MSEFDRAAIVALGSNLPGRFGSPEQLLRRAMTALCRLSETPPRFSSLHPSKPVDCPPGAPDFVNAVAALWPCEHMTPQALFAELLSIEAQFDRRRSAVANTPRTLDLDLICWGSRSASSPSLQLPHPRFARRAFVLAPLAELAPDWIPPGQSRTVSLLLAAVVSQEPAP